MKKRMKNKILPLLLSAAQALAEAGVTYKDVPMRAPARATPMERSS